MLEISVNEVIELAWDDKVSFDTIYEITGKTEAEVKALMRKNLKPGSYRLWRDRVSGRRKKHSKLFDHLNAYSEEEK